MTKAPTAMTPSSDALLWLSTLFLATLIGVLLAGALAGFVGSLIGFLGDSTDFGVSSVSLSSSEDVSDLTMGLGTGFFAFALPPNFFTAGFFAGLGVSSSDSSDESSAPGVSVLPWTFFSSSGGFSHCVCSVTVL